MTMRWKCHYCGEGIEPDGQGAWVDGTDGDACSGDDNLVNENAPHTPLTPAQQERISILCQRYRDNDVKGMIVNSSHAFSLPGWVECWIGGVYFGISPEGEAHS